jgi:hypothetical protein
VDALPCRCCKQVGLLTLLEIEMHVHVHEHADRVVRSVPKVARSCCKPLSDDIPGILAPVEYCVLSLIPYWSVQALRGSYGLFPRSTIRQVTLSLAFVAMPRLSSRKIHTTTT